MLIPYIMLFVVGLICLIKGSDYVTVYASKLAKHCGVSELIIGITVVAMSTSLPELTVSIFSILFETGQIAIGTIIGSNIANVCLIVGISATLYPIKTNRKFLKEGYYTLAFTVLIIIFLLDGMVFYEGATILAVFITYIYYTVRGKKKFVQKKQHVKTERKKLIKYIVLSILGGLIVVVGAQTLIYSTITIAQSLGISELMISLIAIAIGTSLPELAVSFTAAVKKLEGISLGNILGSNIFNIAILGIVSLFSTISVTEFVVFYNLIIMAISVIVLLILVRIKWKITRINGIILLIIYAVFLWIQFI